MGRDEEPIFPHACLHIDASVADHGAALGAVVCTTADQPVEARVEAMFSREHEVIVALSVRTALDLYLRAQRFAGRGLTEVVMSAVNIPDMTVVLEEHNLVPVPVDIGE